MGWEGKRFSAKLSIQQITNTGGQTQSQDQESWIAALAVPHVTLSVYQIVFVAVQSLSHVQLFATPWTAAHQASLSFIGVCSDICPLSQWCHPTISSSVAPFSSCPQSLPDSVSSKKFGFPHQVPKVLKLQLHSINPPNEYLGLIFFKIDLWFDLLAVQGTLKSLFQFLKKLEIELPYDPAIPLLGIHNKETRSERDTCTPMFIAALFIIARTWKQPRCPSADKWIRKLWYIYIMEYYSAIKKNSFESVLMRWIKLEPIIQSEVSQKDKDQYSILMHIYGI